MRKALHECVESHIHVMTVADVCASHIPTDPLDRAHLLESAHIFLGEALGARDQDHDVHGLCAFQFRCMTAMLTDAEMLASDSARVPQYNSFILLWIVYTQITALRALCDTAELLTTDQARDTRTELCHAGLLVWPGSIDAVSQYSMSQWKVAFRVVRERVPFLTAVTPAVAALITALEARAAAFTVGAAASSEYTVPAWCDPESPGYVSRKFIVMCAWQFMWLRRMLVYATRIGQPGFWGHGAWIQLSPWTWSEPPVAVTEFLREHSCTKLRTEDHEDVLAGLLQPYDALLGDTDAHSAAYCVTGERATVSEIISRDHPPSGTTFILTHKYSRPVVQWLEAHERRIALGSAYAGPTADLHGEHRIAFHIFHAFCVTHFDLYWHRHFVVTIRGSGPDFFDQCTKGIGLHVPFCVERLGSWLVVVPPPPHTDHNTVYAHTGGAGTIDDANGVRVYTCAHGIDAIAIWCGAALWGWKGRVYSTLNLEPMLKHVLQV